MLRILHLFAWCMLGLGGLVFSYRFLIVVPKTESVVEAAYGLAAACDTPNFGERLTLFRGRLADIDPDSVECPKTWSNLRAFVLAYDERSGSRNDQVQSSLKALLADCPNEELAALRNRSNGILATHLTSFAVLLGMMSMIPFLAERKLRKLQRMIGDVVHECSNCLLEHQIAHLLDQSKGMVNLRNRQAKLRVDLQSKHDEEIGRLRAEIRRLQREAIKPEPPDDHPPDPRKPRESSNEAGPDPLALFLTNNTFGAEFDFAGQLKSPTELCESFDHVVQISFDGESVRRTYGDSASLAVVRMIVFAVYTTVDEFSLTRMSYDGDSVYWALPNQTDTLRLQHRVSSKFRSQPIWNGRTQMTHPDLLFNLCRIAQSETVRLNHRSQA